MNWQIKYMVDPGDGIVTTEIVQHDSDDLIEVASDWFNKQESEYWLMGIEAISR